MVPEPKEERVQVELILQKHTRLDATLVGRTRKTVALHTSVNVVIAFEGEQIVGVSVDPSTDDVQASWVKSTARALLQKEPCIPVPLLVALDHWFDDREAEKKINVTPWATFDEEN